MKREDITNLFPEATAEQIGQLLNINGADITKAKGNLADVQKSLDASNAEISRLKEGPTAEKLQAEIDRANELQKELDGFKASDALRVMREKVARENKMPVELLTAETEEACKVQAAAILKFAQPDGYPTIKDGGDPSNKGPNGTDAAWADFAAKIGK